MSQEAGLVPDRATFTGSTEPFRRELLAHCYRMVGSVDEAEDLVQETFLRAWRAYDGFEGRSSVRTWLYQIASNTCLTALERSARRPLPSGLGGPGQDAGQPPAADLDIPWLQPIPDALVTPESADPADIAVSRESLRLALIASFQYLPPRQRAVLILRDVLAFPAADVATCSAPLRPRSRARCSEPAPGCTKPPPQQTAWPSRVNPKPGRCSTSTSAPSRRPTRPRWSDCSGQTPRSSCRRRWPGSRTDRPSREPWRVSARRATGGWFRPPPTDSQPRRLTFAATMAATGPTGSWCSPLPPPASPGIVVFADPGLFASFGLPQVQPAAGAPSDRSFGLAANPEGGIVRR